MRLGLLALALVLAACGGKEDIPPPGARGPVVFRLFEAKGGPPIVLRATALQQEGMRFDDLTMRELALRLPIPGNHPGDPEAGVLWIHAPGGRLRSGAEGGDISIDGPLIISGQLGGAPLSGRAASARIDRRQRSLELEAPEIVHLGMLTRSPQASMRERLRFAGPFSRLSAPAGPAAVLAALPDPFPVP